MHDALQLLIDRPDLQDFRAEIVDLVADATDRLGGTQALAAVALGLGLLAAYVDQEAGQGPDALVAMQAGLARGYGLASRPAEPGAPVVALSLRADAEG